MNEEYTIVDLYDYFHLKKFSKNQLGILHCKIQKEGLCPAVFVIPGGAYQGLCFRENVAFADRFYAEGYHSFYIDYSYGEDIPYPTALKECSLALIYIRENAEKFNIDGNHIGAIGFSAGGHLVGQLANLDENLLEDFSDEMKKQVRLNAVMYAYPVVSTKEGLIHEDSFKNLLKDKYDMLINEVSLEDHIKENGAPAFIFHCADDKLVPVENSYRLAHAYEEKNIPVELHIFPIGGHGVALPTRECWEEWEMGFVNPKLIIWYDLCVSWLVSLGFDCKIAK